jgi:MFS family permease
MANMARTSSQRRENELADDTLKDEAKVLDSRRLGLRANLSQFVLFSVLTLWIGWFLGMERVLVPLMGTKLFHISSFLLITSFIVAFGFTKAILNMVAGRWSDKIGRKPVLVLGWIFGLPIPFILMFAPSWGWVVMANVLMGFNQGLAWTMTVTSKIDIVGPRSRGLALGINEFSGYVGQSSGTVIVGFLAASYGLRPVPLLFGLATAILGLAFSIVLARETTGYTQLEKASALVPKQSAETHVVNSLADDPSNEARIEASPTRQERNESLFDTFALTSWRNKTLFSCSQAGLVEKFTDTLLWAMYPLFLKAKGVDTLKIAFVVGLYLVAWGVLQLFTGALSDRVGRKPAIVLGMWIMSVGIFFATMAGRNMSLLYLSSIVIGAGMALVYPVLLASVSDVAEPKQRGAVLGVYRFWRDSGYGFGAIFIGVIADSFGVMPTFYFCSIALFLSGFIALVLMKETLRSW